MPEYVHFATGHDDLVHDVAYDYYGRRVATVSSDQMLRVFDLSEDGEWVPRWASKAHDASINRVIWGPPEHGQIIATCSLDRTVRIWEEQETEAKTSPHRWKRQFQMTSETRTAIYDIAFPPTSASAASTSTGLKLAFISTDGTVQIYECREPQDLTHWIAVDVIHTLGNGNGGGVGGSGAGGGSSSGGISIGIGIGNSPPPPPRETEVAFCIDFCPNRWGGEQLVVGAMDTVRVYRHNALGKFRPAEVLPGHHGLVRDVSWAVSMGRSYHLIATACKDGHVRIFRLSAASASLFAPPAPAKAPAPTGDRAKKPSAAGLSQGLGGAGAVDEEGAAQALAQQQQLDEADGQEGWTVEMIADFSDHRMDVWTVAWNATGTILSSTGDDGKIRLWKMSLAGEFQLLSIISTPRGAGKEDVIEED